MESTASTFDLLTFTVADEQWFEALDSSGPGRALKEHLACVDEATQNRKRGQSTPSECFHVRHVFCAAYQNNDRCFGLPRPTPSYICIVNFSGQRFVLYSENVLLIRMVTAIGPEAGPHTMKGVQQCVDHASKHGTSLLLCFSLPWQVGVEQLHWELRSLERRETEQGVEVRDGAIMFKYGIQEGPRIAASTLDSACIDPAQLEARSKAFRSAFAVCNMDRELDAKPPGVLSGADSEQLAKMSNLLSALKLELNKRKEDLRAEKEDHEKEIEKMQRDADRRVAKVAEKCKTAEMLCRKKMDEMEAHHRLLMEQNNNLLTANRTIAADKAEQDLLFERTQKDLLQRVKIAEASAKVLADKERASEARKAKMETRAQESFNSVIEGLERRLADAQICERRALSRAEELQIQVYKMDAIVDSERAEKEVLVFEHERARKAGMIKSCVIAVASQKLIALRETCESAEVMALSAREAHVEAIKQRQGMEEELQKWTKPTYTTCSTAVNTEPMQEPEELTNLQAEVGRLNTELEAILLRAKEAEEALAEAKRAQARKKKPPPPPGCVEDPAPPPQQETHNFRNQVNNTVQLLVPQGGFCGQANIDIPSDPNGDATMEALIGQVGTAVRALAQVAREGAQHKQAASDMYSELCGIKHSMSQFAPQQQFQWSGWEPQHLVRR